tara:strand:- start:1542 stop:1775 length:234 start_codon:yes stop_codon:yes gene_type:complete
MAKTKGPLCYAPLVQKIQSMDKAIKDMKMKIDKLKTVFCTEEEEICPDEMDSEIAMMELMKDICVEALAEEEPEGDA